MGLAGSLATDCLSMKTNRVDSSRILASFLNDGRRWSQRSVYRKNVFTSVRNKSAAQLTDRRAKV